MGKWFIGGFLGITCLALPWGEVPRGEASVQAEPVWLSDYQAARKTAQATGKPMFVVFR